MGCKCFMANENAKLNEIGKIEDIDPILLDFDELEEKLNSQLEEELSGLEFLEEEKKKIGNPEALGETIKSVVWEQFINQIAATAGDDFIKENNGLNLDLRSEAHIQTTENFAEGKIASHNTKIDYQKRYDDWQSNFVKDKDGNIVTHTDRTGKSRETLVKGARKPFDEGRPSGSTEKHTDMDHTVSAAEIIRDPAANAHMTKEEQIAFANSDANLNEMDSSLNRSKGDLSTGEWLDTPNANNQKPDEIFDISEKEKKKLREKDKEAREELEKQKKEAEERSIKAGKQSQKEEAFRIGGKALRAVVMQLLAELVKEIIGKLVKWFKNKKKNADSLIESVKEAVKSFVSKLKTHMVNAGNTLVSTIATAIWGPIVTTIKKIWTLFKQGWASLKKAIDYLKDPENRKQPVDVLLLEVGKIVVAGNAAAWAIVLGELLEKGLMSIPFMAFEIPLIGSLANILGIFLGAVIAGIVGAIAINLIEKQLEKKRKAAIVEKKVEQGNKVLATQQKIVDLNEEKLGYTKKSVSTSITQRHIEAATRMKEQYDEIFDDSEKVDNKDSIDEMNDILDSLDTD